MTVTSTSLEKDSYSGDGSQHSFAYTFLIYQAADIKVTIRAADGTETVKTLNTHFIVTNVNVSTGGNVLFKHNTGTSSDAHYSTSDYRPQSGETVVLSRNLSINQGTNYIENDTFGAETHETAIDRLTYIAQDLQDQVSRSLKVNFTNAITNSEIKESSSDRANKMLAFDSSGNLQVTSSLTNLLVGTSIVFEGATADAYETTLTVTDPTGSDKTITLPNATGTVSLTSNTETLTNKTLTTPVIAQISNSGTLTLPTSSDTLVGRATTDTLTNKTLTTPVISSISNSGTLTLPTDSDTLVGRATTDTLTNKTLTTPIIAEIDSGSSITLDATTDINLNADGGDIFFQDGAATFGSATNSSGNLIIKSGTTTALTFSGADVTAGGDLTVTGDLTVNGDTTTVNTATLSVEDPLIILAKANNSSDSLDIGFYGLYDTSGSQDLYAGLFRDANDSGKWKLFKDLQAAPDTTVNTSGTGYAVGTLVANLEGDVTGTSSKVTVTDSTANTNFPVVFNNESDALLDDTGTFIYNPSTGLVTATGFSGSLTGTLQTAAQTNITSVGDLDAGSITSGFGAIDNGTSGIRTNTFTAEDSILPSAVGGADLGSTSAEWGDIYIADDKKIYFGSGQDVSLEYDEDGIDTLLISGGDVTLADDKKLYFGTGKDVSLEYDEDGTDTLLISGAAVNFGVDDTGIDVKFFGATSGSYLQWDESADELVLHDTTQLKWKNGSGTTALQIYHHTDNNTYLSNSIGSFNIFQNADDESVSIYGDDGSSGSALYFQAISSTGETKLYHYGNEKISTKSTGIDVTGDLTITSTDAGDGDDPSLVLYRNSSSPADADDLGEILFRGRNDNSEDVEYGKIWTELKDASDGTEDGQLHFEAMRHGTSDEYLSMAWGQVFLHNTLNMQSYSIQFEGSTADDNETTLTVADPTAARTITLPDATGTVLVQDSDGDVTFTGANVNAMWDKSADSFRVNDNGELGVGDSNDLILAHYSSTNNSFLTNRGAGDLVIQNQTDDKDIVFRTDNGSGGVSAYITLDGSSGEIDLTAPGAVDINASSGNISLDASTGNISLTQDTGNMVFTNTASNADFTFTANGTGKVAISNPLDINGALTGATSASVAVDEQVFTSNGTWTKPEGAIMTYIYCVGGGGGGGSGGRGSGEAGGGGGAGGGVDLQMFISAALEGTMSVVVGSGGSGGAAKGIDTWGSNGTAGGSSTVTNDSSVICRGIGGKSGGGGGDSFANGGSVMHRGYFASYNTSSYSPWINDATPGAGGIGDDDEYARSGMPGIAGGGGGGGTATYNSSYRGNPGGKGAAFFNGIGSLASVPTYSMSSANNMRGIGWRGTYDSNYTIWSGTNYFWDEDNRWLYELISGGGGDGGSSDGGNGSNGADHTFGGDGGGSGVGGSSGVAGGNGGNGGAPAGGGGGGGAQQSGDANSGAGGSGGAGKVWIWTVRFAQ